MFNSDEEEWGGYAGTVCRMRQLAGSGTAPSKIRTDLFYLGSL
jgi:hypothetical protein